MADVGNLTAKLTLDTAGFSSGIGEANNLVGSLAGGVGKALGGITATVGAAIAGAAAAVGSLVEDSVKGFAEFEQLAGGAQKIFDQIDYSKIQADASNAWQTMNMSASQYLSMINTVGASFAATMGDEKGYDTAKQGMQAIADYASGTGRSVEELSEKFAMITRSSSSYQSIADQFSGILPATSSAFLEQAQAAGFLNSSYEKLTEVPIAEYQAAVAAMLEQGVEALNLTGNTAAETEGTVSGSFAGMKAAWENLVVSLSQGGEAFDGALETLITAAGNFAEQIIPVISQALQGVSELIAGLAPVIAAELPELIDTVVPMLLEAAISIVNALTEALPDLMTSIMMSLESILPDVSKTIISLIDILVGTIIPEMINFAAMLIGALAEAFINNAGQLSESFMSALDNVINTLTAVLPQIITAGAAIISALAQSFSQNSALITASIVQLMTVLLNSIIQNLPAIIKAGLQIILGLVSGIVQNLSLITKAVLTLIVTFITTIIEHLPDIFKAAVEIGLQIVAGVVFAIPALILNIGRMIGIVDDGASKVNRQANNMSASVTATQTSISGDLSQIVADLSESQSKISSTASGMSATTGDTVNVAQKNADAVISSANSAARIVTGTNYSIQNTFKETLKAANDFMLTLSMVMEKCGESLTNLGKESVLPKVDASGVEAGCNAIISAVDDAIAAMERLSSVSISGGGFGGGHASGGWMSAGTTYLVGELGPELITPTRSGYVHTAEETEDILGGHNSGITININGDVYDNARSMKQKMRSAVLGIMQEQVAYG